MDATAVQHLLALHGDLASRGVALGLAGGKMSLRKPFSDAWVRYWFRDSGISHFATLAAAVSAFEQHNRALAAE